MVGASRAICKEFPDWRDPDGKHAPWAQGFLPRHQTVPRHLSPIARGSAQEERDYLQT